MTQITKTCPACEGKKRITTTRFGGLGAGQEGHTKKRRCPKCEGRGVLYHLDNGNGPDNFLAFSSVKRWKERA